MVKKAKDNKVKGIAQKVVEIPVFSFKNYRALHGLDENTQFDPEKKESHAKILDVICFDLKEWALNDPTAHNVMKFIVYSNLDYPRCMEWVEKFPKFAAAFRSAKFAIGVRLRNKMVEHDPSAISKYLSEYDPEYTNAMAFSSSLKSKEVINVAATLSQDEKYPETDIVRKLPS